MRAALHVYDVDKREDKTVISGIEPDVAISRDGAKALYHVDETFGIVEVAEGKKVGDGKVDAGTLMATVDPPKEWMQMFDEAWRLERDFYYDAAMGGLDWKAIGARYRQLVPYVAHRSDLNYILGELIGELSTSHTYVGGGDMPNVPHVDIGLLGADYALDAASGRYRFQTLYRDRDWNSKVIAPLGVPGVNVKEGEFLLAVNGPSGQGAGESLRRLRRHRRQGHARSRSGRRRTIPGRAPTRSSRWPARRRSATPRGSTATARRSPRRPAAASPTSTCRTPRSAASRSSPSSSIRRPTRHGIIVDERFNGGGFIPDFFVERLRRTTWAYWSTRDGDDFRTPQTAIDGPKCIIVNQYAGSGRRRLPHYFRLAGVRPDHRQAHVGRPRRHQPRPAARGRRHRSPCRTSACGTQTGAVDRSRTTASIPTSRSRTRRARWSPGTTRSSSARSSTAPSGSPPIRRRSRRDRSTRSGGSRRRSGHRHREPRRSPGRHPSSLAPGTGTRRGGRPWTTAPRS